MIRSLIEEGLDVARLNFSHGEHEMHAQTLRAIREASVAVGRSVAILQDLQGPKVRVGTFASGAIVLDPGQQFTLTTRELVGDAKVVSTTYKPLPRDVKPGDQILLDDGLMQLEVVKVDGEDVVTRVVTGGTLKNRKGMNLPGVRLSTPALTEKDKKDLAFGLELGVDFVALSFVREPADILEARQLTRHLSTRVPIIAKIEKPEAVERLEEIIDVADGIMIARGDLGVELGAEKVPLVQKRGIELANRRAKVVITATQMLESMTSNPRPTRAEASDVANAVLDGTDALMLSGETAAGDYPLLAVRTMARIIVEIEQSAHYRRGLDAAPFVLDLPVPTNAVAQAAAVAAKQLNLKVIAAYSETGGSARLLSEYRPQAKILALTATPETYRRLSLYWGVTPMLMDGATTVDATVSKINDKAKALGLAVPGDMVAITMGTPMGESSNLLKLHRVQ
jgi:pyruvate kinase